MEQSKSKRLEEVKMNYSSEQFMDLGTGRIALGPIIICILLPLYESYFVAEPAADPVLMVIVTDR